MYHHDFNEKIGFWYVIALAGQSNGMAYGEGIPLPDTLDKPESRVKQLAHGAFDGKVKLAENKSTRLPTDLFTQGIFVFHNVAY